MAEGSGAAVRRHLWEYLVTEEHVRAARLRAVQPTLIGLGVVLILAGGAIQFSSPPPSVPGRDALLREQVLALQTPAIKAVKDLVPVTVASSEIEDLVPEQQITTTVAPMIIEALNRTGKLPVDRLTLAEVSPAAFWKHAWPHRSLIATGNANVKVVGAIVKWKEVSPPELLRWFGVFRKLHGRWRCVYVFMPLRSASPSADLTNIALDFTPTLPVQK